jgi:hypothetical protein
VVDGGGLPIPGVNVVIKEYKVHKFWWYFLVLKHRQLTCTCFLFIGMNDVTVTVGNQTNLK